MVSIGNLRFLHVGIIQTMIMSTLKAVVAKSSLSILFIYNTTRVKCVLLCG